MDDLKITQTRLYEQVIVRIELLFTNGDLKLGDKIPPERDLSEQLGVSRGTLRDAFRILESQGVIETIAGDGRYLRKDLVTLKKNGTLIEELEKAAERDLIEAREILELGMIELICERATTEDLDELEKIINMEDEQLVNEELSFNMSLAECSKNIVIINFMKLNIGIMKQTKLKSLDNKENILESQKEHRAILNALRQKDINKAKSAVSYHLDKVRERYKSRD